MRVELKQNASNNRNQLLTGIKKEV